jgi:hypothetical protein
MDIRLLILLLVGFAVAGVGILYRRVRSRELPDVSDEVFVERIRRSYAGGTEILLKERRFVASLLSIPVQKLSPEQTIDELRRRFSFLAEFSVGANDLYDEAAEMRQAAGLPGRESPPDTIGELIEDLARGREAIASRKARGA